MFGDGLRILVLLFLTISAFAKPIAANDPNVLAVYINERD